MSAMENACAFASYPDADCLECGDSGEVFAHADDCRDDNCALAGGIDDCDGQVVFCSCEAGEALAAKQRHVDSRAWTGR